MIIELTGSHYDMGYQHGSKLIQHRPGLLNLIAEHRELLAAYPRDVVDRTMDEVSNLLLIHSPRTLDMLKGIADGFAIPLKDLWLLRVASYVEDRFSPGPKSQDADGECTTWAMASPKPCRDRILLAKNRDFLLSAQSLQTVFRCKAKEQLEYFSVNTTGSCNVSSSGINEEGLAIADTRVSSFDVGLGLPRFSLMMHILEQFRSVAEVVDFLRSVPRMGGGNLIFADASGHVGKAEVGYERLEVTQEQWGYVVTTNHFEAPSMEGRYRKKGKEEEKHSRYRFEKVTHRLSNASEGVLLDDAIQLMSHHGERFSICRHVPSGGSRRTVTLSSAIFLPEKRGFYYCEGYPCEGTFHWISF